MDDIEESIRDDDSAVTPVIGIILMVAVTVVLAAVIATFVLGLGEVIDDTAPTISFSCEGDVAVVQAGQTNFEGTLYDGDGNSYDSDAVEPGSTFNSFPITWESPKDDQTAVLFGGC